jgi:serine/threonine protein kinase
MIQKQRYIGPETDVWSLGVILFALVTGHLPFDDENESALHHKITSLEYEIPEHLSPEVQELIGRMLQLRGADRITLQGVLDHPWLNGQPGASTEGKATLLSPSPDTSSATPTPTAEEEGELVARLNALGLQGDAMRKAAEGRRCNALAGLWHLLLPIQRPGGLSTSTLTPGASAPTNSPRSSVPDSLKLRALGASGGAGAGAGSEAQKGRSDLSPFGVRRLSDSRNLKGFQGLHRRRESVVEESVEEVAAVSDGKGLEAWLSAEEMSGGEASDSSDLGAISSPLPSSPTITAASAITPTIKVTMGE